MPVFWLTFDRTTYYV